MRPLILLLATLLWPLVAHAGDVVPASGAYGEMLLAVDPASHVIRGYFSSETGAGKFTCTFYLTGRLEGGKAAVSTYYPGEGPGDLIKGSLIVEGPKSIRVVLPEEHGGCWNVMHFADKDQPADFSLEKPYPWTAVAVVKSSKAFFYDAPGAPAHRKGYMVKGDAVGVRASQPGWLQVDFPCAACAKPTSGWVKRSDLFPME